MAVQKPVAPTPPTPPSVPGVTLQEGGTVRDSNVPQNIKQNNDERQEAQARQAVAQGDGALSKTTTTRPEKPEKPERPAKSQAVDASGGASQAGQTVIVPAEQLPPAGQENVDKAMQAQTKTETQAQDSSPPADFAAHSGVFWGAVILLMAVVSWFGIKKIMSRRKGRRSLSWDDLDGAAKPVKVETFDELRGLTPDEVLKKMAADEKNRARAEARQARDEARQRLEKAGRIPVKTAVPTTAARQYREQVVAGAASADLPKAKPKPVVKSRPPKQEEEQRFEVRI
ncbi:hypothetical protein [Selenomonas sp. AE3005]|uniref:hypothetical protein n=1 Tax=Selenomonas sp. AE3005 TaxID=1485543 RepID=UPI0025E768C0|nr:hypothetical protein [Selenomonas sp. AE3005]